MSTQEEFDQAIAEYYQEARFCTYRVDILTLRSAYPEGTDRKILQTQPLHQMVARIVLVPGFGVMGDRSWGESVEGGDLTLMDTKVYWAIRKVCPTHHLPGDTVLCDYPVHQLRPNTYAGLGSAAIQISKEPHQPCDRFLARFGREATRWVRKNNLRGVRANILESGIVEVGDALRVSR